MRAGLGVETVGTECAEVLEFGETFAIESVDRILGGWCLNSNHVVRLRWRGRGREGSKCKSFELFADGSARVFKVVIRKSRS